MATATALAIMKRVIEMMATASAIVAVSTVAMQSETNAVYVTAIAAAAPVATESPTVARRKMYVASAGTTD